MISDKSANWQNSTPKLMKSVSSVTDVLSEVRDPVEVKENAVSTLARTNMPKLFTRPSLRLTSELEDEKPSPPRLVQCVRSQWFEALCSLCIVINAAFIAYTADYAAKKLRQTTTIRIAVGGERLRCFLHRRACSPLDGVQDQLFPYRRLAMEHL